jgi:flagellar hook-associated protein 1 FlgK
VNGQLVENGTALRLAQIQDAPLESLAGQSLAGLWRDAVQEVGGKSAGAASAASASTLVRESLESQRAAVSGVSLDEESVNLLQYQRQYQASARLISVVDELTRSLIAIV